MVKKSVKYAIKLNTSILFLVMAYYLLQLVILKGELFAIRPLLIFLFSLNCFVVFVKVLKRKG